MEKMNPEVKQKWLKALRSGEYEQAVHWLRVDTSYCCLGVLTHIYEPTHESLFNCACPENEICEWAGLPFSEDSEGQNVTSELMTMNDSGKSFDEIADWIEENL